jgi:hypothetical protein
MKAQAIWIKNLFDEEMFEKKYNRALKGVI